MEEGSIWGVGGWGGTDGDGGGVDGWAGGGGGVRGILMGINGDRWRSSGGAL